MTDWRAIALSALALASAARAQPSIDDASWLVGRWVGEGLGGAVEETWSPPANGQMVGHFQYAKDGKPVFYEIMLVDQTPAGLRMRVKHFNADFTAWEDKAGWHSFEPISAAPDRLEFKGLSLTRSGDLMTAVLQIRGKDGEVRAERFQLRRAPR